MEFPTRTRLVFFALTLISVIGLILSVLSMGPQPAPNIPAVPIHVKLALYPPPPLGHTANLVLTVHSDLEARDVRGNITLPAGLMLISGDTRWSGDIPQGATIEVKSLVKSVRTGRWTVEGVAGYYLKDSKGVTYGWYGEQAQLVVYVTETSAHVSFSSASVSNSHVRSSEITLTVRRLTTSKARPPIFSA